MSKTARDLWIEMSIREIWTQCHFAGIAFLNIKPKAVKPTDAVFSSIHSFLSHCAMVSKMLRANDGEKPPQSIGKILNVSDSSVIHKRGFRNHLEHYDCRLKKWIKQYGQKAIVGTYNIGPKSSFMSPKVILVTHYDPTTSTFTFANKDFNLRVLYDEACRIKEIADIWVMEMEQGRITPPFD